MICFIRRLLHTLFSKDGSRSARIRLLELFKLLFGIKKQVYFDNNATTMINPRVQKRMQSVLGKIPGNPSSLHDSGKNAAELIADARRNIAEAIHADPSEIIFTGSASESNNTILKSLFELNFPVKRKIIALPIEHPSVIKTLEYLEGKGVCVQYCQIDTDGRIRLDTLEKMIDDSTFLICCMLANNEIGTIQDVKQVVEIASKKNIPVFSDCVQAFGKIPVNVKTLGVDYATFSAHKVYGPKGIGALYVKKGCTITPLIHGGHQEHGLRAGTESVHSIAGFGEASLHIDKSVAHAERLQKLKNQMIAEIKRFKNDCVVNSPKKNCLSNTLSLRFPGVKNENILAMLNYYGIEVSAGSACSSGDDKPSYVLKALGLSDEEARESIRISLGSFTKRQDVRYMIKTLKDFFEGKALYVPSITTPELKALMSSDPGIVVLDIRPEFQRNKLPGDSRFKTILDREIEKNLDQIPIDQHVVIACETGQLSILTAYSLKSKGYNRVSSLRDGIRGWHEK